jgi:hypothetical protein
MAAGQQVSGNILNRRRSAIIGAIGRIDEDSIALIAVYAEGIFVLLSV